VSMFLVCCAYAVNVGWMVYHRHQIQAVCETSALAGVAQMFENSPIASGYYRPAGLPGAANVVHTLRVRQDARTRQHALRFAEMNTVDGRGMRLGANWSNRFDGDLVTGWVEYPTMLGAPMEPWNGQGPINSLLVRALCIASRGQALSLWASSMFGFADVDMIVEARASVDQRVVGFRPVGHVAVPMVPLMIASRGDEGEQSDRFTVDPRTLSVAPGRDGLQEFTIRLGRPQQSSEAVENVARIVGFGRTASSHDLEHQIRYGLTDDDLQWTGGVIVHQGITQQAIATTEPSAASLATLHRALRSIRGEKRIWPVGDPGTSSIFGFTALCVVECQEGEPGTLELVIQPCVLQTCTAMVRAGEPRNPRIGKIVLTR
ncbi:MAG: hypothetical protein ACC645_25890, partial [Pirellulales bacterium]